MKNKILTILFTLSMTSCFPSLKIIESEYQAITLTSELAESKDKDFFVYLPNDWFATKDVNYDGNEIWMVHENYSGVIVVKRINLIAPLKSENQNQKLLDLAKVDFALHKRKNSSAFKVLSVPKLYRNGSLTYASFEYEFGKNQIARVVIAEINGKYFECLAYTSDKGQAKISIIELYSTQESVVLSLNAR